MKCTWLQIILVISECILQLLLILTGPAVGPLWHSKIGKINNARGRRIIHISYKIVKAPSTNKSITPKIFVKFCLSPLFIRLLSINSSGVFGKYWGASGGAEFINFRIDGCIFLILFPFSSSNRAVIARLLYKSSFKRGCPRKGRFSIPLNLCFNGYFFKCVSFGINHRKVNQIKSDRAIISIRQGPVLIFEISCFILVWMVLPNRLIPAFIEVDLVAMLFVHLRKGRD